VYVGWKTRFAFPHISKRHAFLKLDDARRFALRSLDGFFRRAGTQSWACSACLPTQIRRQRSAAFLACWKIMPSRQSLCLDAYEASADLSYFHFAEKIAAAMVVRFHDPARRRLL